MVVVGYVVLGVAVGLVTVTVFVNEGTSEAVSTCAQSNRLSRKVVWHGGIEC